MTSYFSNYTPFRFSNYTFYFDYDLERGDECLPIEVAYCLEDGEVYLDSVKFDGKEITTTPEEDKELIAHAYERLSEDVASAEADYGDYLSDMRREQED
jgi:hypothetical protein